MSDRNELNQSREIDLVDFSANSEMQRIRENERIEREKRMKRAAELRRAEAIKRKKIARIKQMVTAWAILIFGVVALIALISGVVSLFNKEDTVVSSDIGDKVSAEETKLVEAFASSDAVVYGKGKAEGLDGMAKAFAVTPSKESGFVTLTSELSMLSDTYAWNSALEYSDNLKDYLVSCPMFSNGYIWSSPKLMKSPVTESGYLYDTNAAFINAVYEVCLWEGDTSFLDKLDLASEARGDISGGKTVKEKLEAAANYYFNDKDPNGGGIRYGFKYEVKNGVLETVKKDDGLVYISTKENDGTPKGHASNLFSTYKFGYLDCYNNMVFYDAMVSLSKIYEMLEDAEKSEYYASVAEENKKAINDTFFDTDKGRYIGYIDADGKEYDSGFTAINLMAIKLGVADEVQLKGILSWLSDGKDVEGDELSAKDVMTGVLPAFSSVSANDSTWDNLGGKYLLSADASFGENWLNGGKSALSGAYNVALQKFGGKDKLVAYINKLSDSYTKGNLAIDTESETAEPALHYSLLASQVIREYFGISTDGRILTVSPLSGTVYDMGIKGISFMRRQYDVLYNKGDVYLMCNVNAPVKMRLGGFDANAELVLTLVDSELISLTEEIKADEKGFVTVSKKFGNTSYIKLETK